MQKSTAGHHSFSKEAPTDEIFETVEQHKILQDTSRPVAPQRPHRRPGAGTNHCCFGRKEKMLELWVTDYAAYWNRRVPSDISSERNY